MQKIAFLFFALLSLSVFCDDNNENQDMSIYEAKTFSSGGQNLNYRWAVPQDFKQGEKYPLVVVLHGLGEKGNDNKKTVETWRPSCNVLCAQELSVLCHIAANRERGFSKLSYLGESPK